MATFYFPTTWRYDVTAPDVYKLLKDDCPRESHSSALEPRSVGPIAEFCAAVRNPQVS